MKDGNQARLELALLAMQRLELPRGDLRLLCLQQAICSLIEGLHAQLNTPERMHAEVMRRVERALGELERVLDERCLRQ